MTDTQFDIAVIGGGPGGYVAAIRAAQLGLKPVVIERENLGGICLNWGCIPTKALLRAAELRHSIDEMADFGITVGEVKIDLTAVVKRSRKVAARLSTGVKHLLKKNEVTDCGRSQAWRDKGRFAPDQPVKWRYGISQTCDHRHRRPREGVAQYRG